jgi:hypothetical protein
MAWKETIFEKHCSAGRSINHAGFLRVLNGKMQNRIKPKLAQRIREIAAPEL